MIDRTARWLAAAAGGRLAAGPPDSVAPGGVCVDSRLVERGDLFVGLPGECADGGSFAAEALARGAWGVIAAPEWAHGLAPGRVVIAVEEPDLALQRAARAWRAHLACAAVAITGSTGKTSTKDILAGMLTPHLRTHATRRSFNTRHGVAATILGAPAGTEALVVEIAMRNEGEIAGHCGALRPTAGVITGVGADHLETVGSLQGVARAKAELIQALAPGASCVTPAGEPLLDPHLRDDLCHVTFGEGGDVSLISFDGSHARIDCAGEELELELPYSEAHNVRNTLAAVTAAGALGIRPAGRVVAALSPNRGQIAELMPGVAAVLDCAKTSPPSLAAALEELGAVSARRRIAVLGAMPDLGEAAPAFHRRAGEHAQRAGVDLLIGVGPGADAFLTGFRGRAELVGTAEEAARLLRELAQPGDRVLLKAVRYLQLEAIAERAPVTAV